MLGKFRVGLILAVPLALAFVAFVALVAVRAVNYELEADFRPDRRPIALPAWGDLYGMRAVNLASAGEPPLTAFFRPAVNGHIVILLHGTGANRSQLMPEARMLARHGFGVLSLDWPGHGESGGNIQWGESERHALTRAIDWATQAPGIQPRQVGLLGFSMGSWIALQVAADDQRVYAVAVTGAFPEMKMLLAKQGGRWGALSSSFAMLTARLHGMHYLEKRGKDVIGRVSPRPVLLVAGTADQVVPPAMTEQLYRFAHEPKSLWIVPGADHGQYATVAPAEYESRLVQLFTTGAGN